MTPATTQRTALLNTGRLSPALVERLKARYDYLDWTAATDREALLADHGPRVQGVVTSAPFGLDAPTLAALPGLRVISSHCAAGRWF